MKPDALTTISHLINSPPGQLAAGGVLAGIVWKCFERVEAVLTDQTKLEIAGSCWIWIERGRVRHFAAGHHFRQDVQPGLWRKGSLLEMCTPVGCCIFRNDPLLRDFVNRHFDIEKKPLQSIGLVAGALVAVVYRTSAIVSRLVG